MAIRPIVKYGDPVLHAPAAPVERIDDEIRALFDDMIATMYAAPGIGLAAPQIGVPLRVIVIDLSVGEDPAQVIKLVNPEFLEREGEQKHEEGCLSDPRLRRLPHPPRPGRRARPRPRRAASASTPPPSSSPAPSATRSTTSTGFSSWTACRPSSAT